jgi:Domain of unknown function (DUF4372)/Transposase DDE domain
MKRSRVSYYVNEFSTVRQFFELGNLSTRDGLEIRNFQLSSIWIEKRKKGVLTKFVIKDAMREQHAPIFTQVMRFLPQRQFQRIVERHGGNANARSFSCWDQFLCMAFAQLTYRESLRDIEATLRSIGMKLYHLGIRGRVSRSTLSDANNNRNAKIFEEFAQLVIAQAQKLYCNEKFSVEIKNAAYCLDASVVDLCLSLCPWAKFGNSGKAGIKLHTLLDLRGNIPSLVIITPRKTYETTVFGNMLFEPGAFYIMDRGYFDWSKLYRVTTQSAFFVIRSRKDLSFRRQYSRSIVKGTGVLSDHIGLPAAGKGQRMAARSDKKYPQSVRRIRYRDSDSGRTFTYLTNNHNLPARTIADLYRARWRIELFFKWIKQHLRIKKFYGTSENAVKIQIYIAITTYVLIAIAKKTLSLPHDLHTVLQVLSVTCIEKTPILSAFSDQSFRMDEPTTQIQLDLLGF